VAGETGEIRAVLPADFPAFRHERVCLDPAVPDQDHRTAAPQDAAALLPELHRVEPVERLYRKDRVDASRRQRGAFGGADDGDEAGHSAQLAFRLLAHIGVGFDCVKAAYSLFQQQPRENAGAGTDLGGDGVGSDAGKGFQAVEKRRRVAGAVTAVDLAEAGEFFSVVLHVYRPVLLFFSKKHFTP